MNKKTIINFIIFLLFLFSFQGIEAKKPMKNKPKENYVTFVNEIVNQFTKEMSEKHEFICIETGGGMPYDVEEIFVKFQVYQRVTIEQARKLEIMATKRLQELVNSHEKIRPFLREYPFSTDRCRVFLTFRQKDNNYYTDGSLSYIFQARGILYYYFENNENEKDDDEVLSEMFKKAEKIVEEEMAAENNNDNSNKKL